MRGEATGIQWIPRPRATKPDRLPRILVSPGSPPLKLRNSGPELGRRQLRPKWNLEEAYLQKRAPSWIERLLPARVAASEFLNSVNTSAAAAGPAVEVVGEAGREAVVAAWAAVAEGKERL